MIVTDRENLMKRVQICDFALNDTALYLDTHPRDAHALAYYKRFKALRESAAKEYTERFGPLMSSDCADGMKWDWVNDPWPWHTEEA